MFIKEIDDQLNQPFFFLISGDVFSFVGDSNITATVSATDTMTIQLNSNIE